MKKWIVLALVAVTASVAVALCVRDDARSVRFLPPRKYELPKAFDSEQSAALFVGVRQFPGDRTLDEVPYAVDDAVDLAYAFSLERNSTLVRPKRVVLALSGGPAKAASRQRLEKLRAAGAHISTASANDIVRILERQARLAKRDGVFIVAVASHGFSREGTPYVLASTSIVEQPETWLSSAKISDIAATSKARRSLIFIDACRERVTTAHRGVQRPREVPAGGALQHAFGQAIFYAGVYAYDDYKKQNGVFTNAILEALRCGYARTHRGLVTVDILSNDLSKRVTGWIRENRDPNATDGIRLGIDGNMKKMTLAACAPPCAPTRVVQSAAGITLLCNDTPLWERAVNGRVARAEIADLNGDQIDEVVVAVDASEDEGLPDAGRIIAFDADGERLWMTEKRKGALDTFKICELFHKERREIVTTSIEAGRWRLSVFKNDGAALGSYEHSGPMHTILIDRPTANRARKIIVTARNDRASGGDAIFMLDPKRVGKGPLWYAVIPQRIKEVKVIDYDNDGRRDIAVTTSTGTTSYLDFDGERLAGSSTFTKLSVVP